MTDPTHGHRKWILPALVAAGVVVFLYLRSKAAGSSSAGIAQATGQGDPYQSAAQALAAQAAQQQQTYQNAMDQIAAQYGSPQSPLSVGKDKGGNAEYSYGQGAVSKAWQQIYLNGQTLWEDIYHPGHVISDSQAQALAASDHGPYARGGGGVLGSITGFLGTFASSFVGGLIKPPVPGVTTKPGLPTTTPPIAGRRY